jgi:hypothetical protein
MEKDVEDRLERMEAALKRMAEAHIDLQAAQKDTAEALERFVTESNRRGKEIDYRIVNLTALLNELINTEWAANKRNHT